MPVYTLFRKARDAPEDAPASKVKSWRLPDRVQVKSVHENITVPADSEAVIRAWEIIDGMANAERLRFALIRDTAVVMQTAFLDEAEHEKLRQPPPVPEIEREPELPEYRQEQLL